MVCPVCLHLAAPCSQLVNGEKTLGGGRAEIFLLESQQKAGTLCERGLTGGLWGELVWCWCRGVGAALGSAAPWAGCSMPWESSLGMGVPSAPVTLW